MHILRHTEAFEKRGKLDVECTWFDCVCGSDRNMPHSSMSESRLGKLNRKCPCKQVTTVQLPTVCLLAATTVGFQCCSLLVQCFESTGSPRLSVKFSKL